MNQRNRRTAFEIKDNRRLTFYAAVFEEPTTIYDRAGNFQEVIKRGAFTKSLANQNQEVIATVDHNPELTIAQRTKGELLLQEDPHGLFASLWLPENDLGDSVKSGVESGKIWGCSFGASYNIDRNQIRTNGILEVTEADLFDVCVAQNGDPAYPQTEVHLRTTAYLNSLIAKYRYLNLRLSMLNNSNNHKG